MIVCLLIVAEVAVVDDGRVEQLRVGFYDLVGLVADHAGGLAVLRVDCQTTTSSVIDSSYDR